MLFAGDEEIRAGGYELVGRPLRGDQPLMGMPAAASTDQEGLILPMVFLWGVIAFPWPITS